MERPEKNGPAVKAKVSCSEEPKKRKPSSESVQDGKPTNGGKKGTGMNARNRGSVKILRPKYRVGARTTEKRKRSETKKGQGLKKGGGTGKETSR